MIAFPKIIPKKEIKDLCEKCTKLPAEIEIDTQFDTLKICPDCAFDYQHRLRRLAGIAKRRRYKELNLGER